MLSVPFVDSQFYFLRLQRSLCHQPWDLRPRGCLVGSEGEGRGWHEGHSHSNVLQRGATCSQRCVGDGMHTGHLWWPLCLKLTC